MKLLCCLLSFSSQVIEIQVSTPCGVFYHAHMISSPFAPPISLLSSKECWEDSVKLALRFIFCLDKVLGKLFHSQDKCY